MGQATRTTKLLLDLGNRRQGGANTGKRAALDATVGVLNEARAFYIDFFLAHASKLSERIPYYSEQRLEMRERAISANELLSWAEACTVETQDHPQPWEGWNFTQRFPDMPAIYRRSVIKDAIGKVRAYLSSLAHWEKSGKKKGKPGLPGARDHPTLYQGTCSLERAEVKSYFVRLKVYDGRVWQWVNYPVVHSRYFQQRQRDPAWEHKSPTLVLSKQAAALHFPQVKQVSAQKVKESKLDPDLVTVAVDLNVKRAPRNWHRTLPEAGNKCSLVGWGPAPTGLLATSVASGEATRGKTATRTMWTMAENSLCCWSASER